MDTMSFHLDFILNHGVLAWKGDFLEVYVCLDFYFLLTNNNLFVGLYQYEVIGQSESFTYCNAHTKGYKI
jgi:hypothetical protein